MPRYASIEVTAETLTPVSARASESMDGFGAALTRVRETKVVILGDTRCDVHRPFLLAVFLEGQGCGLAGNATKAGTPSLILAVNDLARPFDDPGGTPCTVSNISCVQRRVCARVVYHGTHILHSTND